MLHGGRGHQQTTKSQPLMELRDKLEITRQIFKTYRPDLVADALASGRSDHIVRSRACQAIEDQQVQILEYAFEQCGLAVGVMIYDAVMVERATEGIINECIKVAVWNVKDNLVIEAMFKTEPWPHFDAAADVKGVPEILGRSQMICKKPAS